VLVSSTIINQQYIRSIIYCLFSLNARLLLDHFVGILVLFVSSEQRRLDLSLWLGVLNLAIPIPSMMSSTILVLSLFVSFFLGLITSDPTLSFSNIVSSCESSSSCTNCCDFNQTVSYTSSSTANCRLVPNFPNNGLAYSYTNGSIAFYAQSSKALICGNSTRLPGSFAVPSVTSCSLNNQLISAQYYNITLNNAGSILLGNNNAQQQQCSAPTSTCTQCSYLLGNCTSSLSIVTFSTKLYNNCPASCNPTLRDVALQLFQLPTAVDNKTLCSIYKEGITLLTLSGCYSAAYGSDYALDALLVPVLLKYPQCASIIGYNLTQFLSSSSTAASDNIINDTEVFLRSQSSLVAIVICAFIGFIFLICVIRYFMNRNARGTVIDKKTAAIKQNLQSELQADAFAQSQLENLKKKQEEEEEEEEEEESEEENSNTKISTESSTFQPR
jgi:hypothetical protein